MLRRGYLIPEDLCRVFRDAPYKLLILLVIVDFVFILLHILTKNTELIHGRQFLVSKDHGYAEVFQYIKEFWIVLLLFYLAIRRSSYLLLVWSLIFTYILFDDALRIHEQVGAMITNYFGFGPALGLPGRQFAQFIIAAIIGSLIVIVLGSSYFLSDRKFRSISNSLLVLFAAFVFFSFFVDIINEFYRRREIGSVIAIIEDGGEMIVMSVITWYVFSLEPESED